MATIILKTITMTLDPHSIAMAIETVNALEGQLGEALSELARYLTEERGVKTAQMFIAQFPAVDTGALNDSIKGQYDKQNHSGTVSAGVGYAAYVEYGTGIVGASNPHPEPNGWEYDVNHHGIDGWWYPSANGVWVPKKGKNAGTPMAWTAGMPARPFMYNTLQTLSDEVEREGGRIVAQYLLQG